MSSKVYQIVTDNIIAMLDQGVVPWRKAWRTRGGSLPRNAWNRPYRGINVFILATTAAFKGYGSAYWLTFKQTAERGGRVREGEKGTLVVFWSTFEVEDRTAKSGKKRVPMLRYFTVFNLDQTHDVKLTKVQQAEASANEVVEDGPEFAGFDDAEAIIGTYFAMEDAPMLEESGSQPRYSRLFDTITMPVRSDFEGEAEYYSTLFHEMTHSTGHAARLERHIRTDFNHYTIDKRADEELVAEFGAAFLCAESGIDNTVENSVAYIQSWRQALRDDPTLVVKAAGKAQKAADYILGTTFEKEVTE